MPASPQLFPRPCIATAMPLNRFGRCREFLETSPISPGLTAGLHRTPVCALPLKENQTLRDIPLCPKSTCLRGRFLIPPGRWTFHYLVVSEKLTCAFPFPLLAKSRQWWCRRTSRLGREFRTSTCKSLFRGCKSLPSLINFDSLGSSRVCHDGLRFRGGRNLGKIGPELSRRI